MGKEGKARRKRGHLTPKQEKFVREFVKLGDGEKAAINSGYSIHTAKHQASRLLTKTPVQRAIVQMQEKVNKRAGLTIEDITKQLRNFVNIDVNCVYNEDGSFKPLNEWPEDCRQAILQIEMGEGGIPKSVKFHDKARAMELAGKHLGMWNDKQHHVVETYESYLNRLAGQDNTQDQLPSRDVTPPDSEEPNDSE